TTSVDIHATLMDLFGVTQRQRTHGKSLVPLIEGRADKVRDWVLTGVWGREVCLVTDHCKYVRGPAGANAPLSMLSNRWSTMPTHVLPPYEALPLPDHRAVLGRMPGSDVPVIHQRWEEGDAVPFWARFKPKGHFLFDLAADPDEATNLAGTPAEAALAQRLRDILVELEAPLAQFERLGLVPPPAAAGAVSPRAGEAAMARP
ncbi:MAG: hypothetical protein JSR86_21765, partial [Proteobacteria bacterium]|nr:hypothetical protein [Pseudomonadota bacterium]